MLFTTKNYKFMASSQMHIEYFFIKNFINFFAKIILINLKFD